MDGRIFGHLGAETETDTPTDFDAEAASDAWIGPSIKRGVVGGVVATAVMSLYRLPVFRALPPTAEFWATYLGDGEAEDYPLEGLLLHLVYGAGGGVPFSLLFTVAAARSDRDPMWLGMVGGAIYGFALSIFGEEVVVETILGEDLEQDEAAVFLVGHIIYGLSLGTWICTRKRFGEVYDD